MSRRSQALGGYILVEATVALVLLSVGSMTVHRTIQEAIRTRGQAQDYTHARFLLTQIVAGLEIQPELLEHSEQGQFSGKHSRFSWAYRVQRVSFPMPRGPLRPPPKGAKQGRNIEYVDGQDYLAHVHASVSWIRSGRAFSESYETLLGPDHLWQPPKARQ